MNELINYVIYIISNFGSMGVFWASVLEEVVLFIPSTLVQTGAGFLILNSHPININSIIKLITNVSLPAAMGVTLGSLWLYAISYYGGEFFLRKLGKFIFVTDEKIEKAKTYIRSKKSILYIITILRFLPIFPNTIITISCGLLKISLWEYILTTIIGIFIRTTYLGAIGWLSYNYIDSISSLDSIISKILVLFILLITISIITRILVKNKN